MPDHFQQVTHFITDKDIDIFGIRERWRTKQIIKFVMGVVYGPQGKILKFSSQLEDSLSTLLTLCDGLINGGDCNINIFQYKTSPFNLLDLLKFYNLRQVINQPTGNLLSC